MLPLIGITLDCEPAGGWSRYPWYALRRNYAEAIAACGGAPVALPHLPDLAAELIERLDGLVITGGAFDIDPALYSATTTHPTVRLKSARTAAESAFLRAALERNIPVLGICGGEQLLAAMLGGRLIQHIPEAISAALAHEQPNPRHEASHKVEIVPGSLLHRLTGAERMAVNSSHHQAVAEPGPELTVNARAPDGVIEGVEAPGRRFCLGVQWHPEFLIDPGDRRLLAGFVAACR